METDRRRTDVPARAVAGLDVVTWIGVGVATVVGAWLRLVAVSGHLPQIVEPDEPTTVERALGVLDGTFAPPLWDWPPGGAILDAAVLRLADLVGIGVLDDVGTRYLVSRVAFALFGLLVVPSGAVLAGRLTEPGRERRIAAITTAGVLAVSFLLVRFGRQVHPDPLQSVFVVLAALAALRARGAVGTARTVDAEGARVIDESTDVPGTGSSGLRWFVLAGVFAGLAAAMKFVGGIVVVPVAVAALVWPSSARDRVAAFAAVGFGSLGAFVVATGGSAVTDMAGLVEGLEFQFGFQSAPRLGYEGSEAVVPWLFGAVLPGTLGWPMAVLALVGSGWLVARGRPGDRFVAGAALTLLAYPLVTSVRFPHYVLPALPLLVVGGAVLVARLLADARRGAVVAGGVTLVAVVAGSWLPLSGDLGLVAASRSADTREQATSFVAEQPPSMVVAEAYAIAREPDVYVGSAPPGVGEECDCLYVVSSYNTDRYERLPDTYDAALEQYGRFVAAHDVVATFTPDVPLDYRWNLLPQWGVGGLAFRDGVVTGPTVTVLRVD